MPICQRFPLLNHILMEKVNLKLVNFGGCLYSLATGLCTKCKALSFEKLLKFGLGPGYVYFSVLKVCQKLILYNDSIMLNL